MKTFNYEVYKKERNILAYRVDSGTISGDSAKEIKERLAWRCNTSAARVKLTRVSA